MKTNKQTNKKQKKTIQNKTKNPTNGKEFKKIQEAEFVCYELFWLHVNVQIYYMYIKFKLFSQSYFILLIDTFHQRYCFFLQFYWI